MARHVLFILAVSAFVFISFMLYWSVDSNAKRRKDLYSSEGDADVRKLMAKVESLKQQVHANQDIMKQMDEKLLKIQISPNDGQETEEQQGKNVLPPPPPPGSKHGVPKDKNMDEAKRYKGNKVEVVFDLNNRMRTTATLSTDSSGKYVCPAMNFSHVTTKSDVQMLNVYDVLPFDNIDGGVWKQGWKIDYDKQTILKEKRLEVVIVPHSHNDPGWIKTFEKYYEDQTKNILDKMAKHLSEKEDMSFIYAEMSFFEMWWSELNDETREKVKRLLKNGQLEIVSGGWVMTDEANAHYYATIMEMIEGHEFIKNQLGITPTSHWSIDPFGLSPTIAYLMNRAKLTHMTIQRVHYSVKKHLAKSKQLEFKWRQLFSGESTGTDIMTHMMPFFSYDVPHTCGPEPAICCQFDFRRLTAFFCPWNKPPVRIDSDNVAQRAAMLADQYRKKAQLYKMNTLLIPLGDDFRYDTDTEWLDQYQNYKKLLEYMNAQEDWNIHARFGTLNDYFSLLERRLDEDTNDHLPTLSGDFFTYADRDDHYWSGYFTSRPFYKHMDRTLQHYLRSADILFTLASAHSSNKASTDKFSTATQMYDHLVEARRALSLFQHHDGVTGTAKRHVVVDYGDKMLTAIKKCKSIIAKAAEYLMNFPPSREEKLKVDEFHYVDHLPDKIVTEDGSSIVVFNSLAHPREEVTCIHVNSWKSRISRAGSEDPDVPQQIGPVFHVTPGGSLSIYKDKFELCYMATLPALGFTRYNIFEAEETAHRVKIHVSDSSLTSPFFEVVEMDTDAEVSIKNHHLKATFDPKSGYLKSVTNKAKPDPAEFSIDMTFVHYGARPHNTSRNGDSLSGAYLFLPDGPARTLPAEHNIYAVVKGSVKQYVFVKGPSQFGLQQCIGLDKNARSLSVHTQINLAAEDTEHEQKLENNEIAMRFNMPHLGTAGDDKVYTDLNGFQMIRRQRFDKLPLQAQYYPMAGAVFIEDAKHRISLLGRQALGASSLQSGQIEIMLDRRLASDDDRGLGEGVLDNHATESMFHLLLENMEKPSHDTPKEPMSDTIGYHSLVGHHVSLAAHYPPMVLIGQVDHASSSEVLSHFSGVQQALPCDTHLVALRTTSQPTQYTEGGRSTAPESSAALVLHRFGVDCRPDTPLRPDCRTALGEVRLRSIFEPTAKSFTETSLTLLHPTNKTIESVTLDPMEVRSLKMAY
ncbi:alpha mannosidase middle domain-containing protein [Ditylenchus destructor]|uniref:Alpha-mannosidase n=1 Tax=Ditylenchus destructor TaxID=166010 RepID=A0AAD4R128_9BILA|nr:alpha mannosidase middle domain-containing protein [Ditylenchus destructor]